MTPLLQRDDVLCISKWMMDVHLNPVLWASQHAWAKRFLIVILSPASNWASNAGHGKLRLPHICFFIGPEMSMRFDLQPALCEPYLFTWRWKMASLKLSTSQSKHSLLKCHAATKAFFPQHCYISTVYSGRMQETSVYLCIVLQ